MVDDRFIFRNVDNVGVPDAEEDQEFLTKCFIDTGYLAVLENCADPRRLVLGRTGSGKSALLHRLRDTKKDVITVQPLHLALEYLSNSNILEFFASIGVELDLFFKLLWRHVLAVEVIRHKNRIVNEEQSKQLLGNLWTRFGKSKKLERALQYLDQWGSSFWLEAESRIVEVAQKFEHTLSANAGVETSLVKLGVEGAKSLTSERKEEVQQRAQKVVNSIQMSELSAMLKLIDELLDDPQQPVYILIDKLDENWISEKLRYRLLRSLVETIRDFRQVRHLKVIAALRIDLIERVFRLTRTPGFQEEKYSSLFLNIEWSDKNLFDLLNERVRYLVQSRYAKKTAVALREVLPAKVDGQDAFDFIVSRTMRRPRDVISFFNHCVMEAVGKHKMTNKMLVAAEGQYSRARLRALADEWGSDYPYLMKFADLLKRRSRSFRLDTITDNECQEFALELACDAVDRNDELSRTASLLAEGLVTPSFFRATVAQAFYRIGLLGVKLAPDESTVWSLDGRRSVSAAEFADHIKVAPHPMAYRALGIKSGQRLGES